MAYLLQNPNPNAPKRSDGQYWGRPSRRAPVRLIVLHTSQSAFDEIGPDTGAEGVAGYLSRVDRPASYHDIGDRDSLVVCLPPDHVAYGSRGSSDAGIAFNEEAIHVAFAGDAYKWDELSGDSLDARLRMVAASVAAHAEREGIAIVRLVGTDAHDPRKTGICGHTDLDPARRRDPGSTFPWDRFLSIVRGDTTAPPPKPPPPAPDPKPTKNWTEQLVDELPLLKRRTNLGTATDDDRRVQGLLAAAGKLEVSQVNLDGNRFDGKFGPSTERAVRAFQRSKGLAVDGIVGRNTWTALLGG